MNRDPKTTRAAIRQLRAHLNELQQVDPEKVGGPEVFEEMPVVLNRLQGKINRTTARVFGNGTPEYLRHVIGPFVHQPRKPPAQGFHFPLLDLERDVRNYKRRVGYKIEELIELLSEEVESLEGLNLNPHIEAAAGQLFKDGHYADAVEAACKMLKTLVQNYSGRRDLDGAKLMSEVFTKNTPILAFNALSNQSDLDEQEGMMFLFRGVMSAFRNPRSHDFVQDHPEDALQAISFISFLAKQLDRTTKV